MADQSILISAVLPASPMPLFCLNWYKNTHWSSKTCILSQFRKNHTCFSARHVAFWADTSPINCGNDGFALSQVGYFSAQIILISSLNVEKTPLILALVVLCQKFMIWKLICQKRAAVWGATEKTFGCCSQPDGDIHITRIGLPVGRLQLKSHIIHRTKMNWVPKTCPLVTFYKKDLKQSLTFVWILTRTNIRIYLCQKNDTNEYTNIFVWNFLTRTNIRIYLYQNFDTNEYPNIFVSKNSYEWIFEYIHIRNIRMNLRIYLYSPKLRGWKQANLHL